MSRRLAPLSLLLTVLALAGCGGTSSAPTPSSTTTTGHSSTTTPVSAAVHAETPRTAKAAAGHPGTRAPRPSRASRVNGRSSTETSRRKRGASEQPLHVAVHAPGTSGFTPRRPAGAMAVASRAFGEDAPIPARYTCAGAVSPPLQWGNLPKGTSSLALIVTETSGAGTAARWLLANIDPSQGAIAEGQTPAGAVIGSNAEGRLGYGGVCPHAGKPYQLQFALYALSKPVAVSTGFQPAELLQAAGAAHALLGVTVLKAVSEGA